MVLRWVGLAVFALVLAIVFVQLGQWQLRRLDERRANNEAVRQAETSPVVDWQQYFTDPLDESDEWHRVRITGHYLSDQYVVRFRSNGDARGYEVVTPIRTEDGTVVLVNRGFGEVPSGQQMPTTAPPAPDGQVTVVGLVRLDESGGSGAEVPQDSQVRVVNSTAIGADLGTPVASGWIQLAESTPPQDGLVPAALPELTEGPHLSYAVQWFAFTVIGVVGVGFFVRSDLRARRRQRARSAARAARIRESGTPAPETGAEATGTDADTDADTARRREP